MAWAPPTNPAPVAGDTYTYQGIVYQSDGKRWLPKGPDLSTMLPATVHAATLKTTPVDADEFPLVDSASAFSLKRVTWASMKSVLLAYFKGQFREKLSAARTYYVATNGNDNNDGLTAGSPFLTIQKAIDTVVMFDLSIYQVTIQLADGTYSGALVLKNFVGDGPILIQGNSTTPNNVLVTASSANTFYVSALSSKYTLRKFKTDNTGSQSCIYAEKNSQLTLVGVNFGACTNAHVLSADGSTVFLNDNYEISGNAYTHFYASYSGQLIISGGVTVTLVGTPAFSYAFAAAPAAGFMRIVGVTFSGSGTGKRYVADLNSVIQVGGASATFLPGNTAGTTSTGGQYA